MLSGRGMKNNLLLSISIGLVVASSPLLRAAEVPDKSEIKEMTNETMTEFGEALKKKDFSEFHDHIADLWKKQVSADKLMDSFKSMAGENFDILGIVQELKPTFEPDPEINSDDVLVIKGYYPTKPNHVTFRLKYIQEDEEWKLVGIDVKTQPAE